MNYKTRILTCGLALLAGIGFLSPKYAYAAEEKGVEEEEICELMKFNLPIGQKEYEVHLLDRGCDGTLDGAVAVDYENSEALTLCQFTYPWVNEGVRYNIEFLDLNCDRKMDSGILYNPDTMEGILYWNDKNGNHKPDEDEWTKLMDLHKLHPQQPEQQPNKPLEEEKNPPEEQPSVPALSPGSRRQLI
jgi:hypothetical protein